MKSVLAILLLSAEGLRLHVGTSDPIAKATSMLQDLKGTVKKEQEEATSTYKAAMENCRSTKAETNHNIELNNGKISELTATNEKAVADIERLRGELATLAQNIGKAQSNAEEATAIRKKERADFADADKELGESIDMCARAISVLRKYTGSKAFLQQGSPALMKVFSAVQAVMEAASLHAADKDRLQALLQSAEGDTPFGMTEAKAYEDHSAGIVDVLSDMKTKAESDKTNGEMEELKSENAFKLLKQGLDDSVAAQSADKARKEQELAGAQESKGTSDGGLADEKAALKDNENFLATATQSCADTDSDYQSQTKGRTEEMGAIDEAIKVLTNPEFTSASAGRQAMFLQVTSIQRGEVVGMLQGMAKQYHSTKLAEIALSAQVSDDDTFAKVNGMIINMINKLRKQLNSETNHNQFCKKNQAETSAKHAKTSAELDGINARLGQAEANLNTLKEEMADLTDELSNLDANVAAATKIRNQEASDFATAQSEFQTGLEGLNQAITILSTYFGSAGSDQGHDMHQGSASTIISLLDTTMQDFQTGVAEAQRAESKAQSDFDSMMQASKVSKAQKTAALKGKDGESVRLASAIEDFKADSQNTEDELKAVSKAMEKLNAMCTTKAVSFEDRMAKMSNEIAGLKHALKLLSAAN